MGRKKIAIEKIQDSRLRIVSTCHNISSHTFNLHYETWKPQIS